LKAEIERQKEINKKYAVDYDCYSYAGKAEMCIELLSFIDSLQQEQPEVDFEKAYKSYMKSRKDDLYGNAVTVNMKDMARHFFELGLNTRKEG
jgi:hypothetical protein